ncbi:protein possibly involved in post-translational modification of quorum-sensing peptides [Desulfosporosinus acidiphilus SJ4]|uniref:Protein possibly involved in post-translational modification of quorum-sensing peptides n=1 Tax=Desulfosporosinus acidiphilus (strain DSM 22704 / JCM 16185 / SJ4) TaxID=646529 RepID=I4D941_DESAJ|nr:accessory gene regulator B family protein [Desulfosporosinus acidiphilus]AFM42315.1 protein possibly involved in post-translational modification of quorum-sensing peptides [Desulfosporosinus acidiphilus SJ4]
MNLSDLSNQISDTIVMETKLDNEKKEILSYAVETFILSITGTLLVVLTSYIFHVMIPALIATFFGGSLRRLSGGAHFNTPFKCLMSGAIIYTFIGFISEQAIRFELVQVKFGLPFILFCLITVGILAPVDSPGKPIRSKKLRRTLKILSIIFVLVVMVVLNFTQLNLLKVSSLLGITYQCITLFPIFNRKEVEL